MSNLDINSNEHEEGKNTEFNDGYDILNLGDYKNFVNIFFAYNFRSKKISGFFLPVHYKKFHEIL